MARGRRGATAWLAESERLGSPPVIWQAAALLARALAEGGDDAGAELAARQARETVDAFSKTLSDERRERFLGSARLAKLIPAAR